MVLSGANAAIFVAEQELLFLGKKPLLNWFTVNGKKMALQEIEKVYNFLLECDT